MIAVVLFTHDRRDYALNTLNHVYYNLTSNVEDFWFHVADDGSPEEEREAIVDRARELYGSNVSVTNSERNGYGASYNLATQVVHKIADLILPLEDDWELVRPFNIDPVAEVLRDGTFGCVRLGYIGATQELRGSFVSARGMWWLHLDPDSAEPHVFAGHPRLETVEWERRVGPWPENLAAGDTEFAVAHLREARESVAWPVDLIRPSENLFAHFGTQKA